MTLEKSASKKCWCGLSVGASTQFRGLFFCFLSTSVCAFFVPDLKAHDLFPWMLYFFFLKFTIENSRSIVCRNRRKNQSIRRVSPVRRFLYGNSSVGMHLPSAFVRQASSSKSIIAFHIPDFSGCSRISDSDRWVMIATCSAQLARRGYIQTRGPSMGT